MFLKLLKKIDFFGQSVQLTFRKESKFRSEIGGVASLFFYIVLGTIIVIKSLTFFDSQNTTKTVTSQLLGEAETIDLFALNYRFAIEKVDPRIGSIEVFQKYISADRGKNEVPILMKDCQNM